MTGRETTIHARSKSEPMQLATEIVRFFHIDISADVPARPVSTIDDFSRSKPEWYETLDLRDVFRICSVLERDGYLVSTLSAGSHPILGRGFIAPDFDERKAAYGEYEFVAHGFHRVREHFQNAVIPVVVENAEGSQDIGTCFLAGNSHTLVTARHVIENARKVEINGINGTPITLLSLMIPKNQDLDIAFLYVDHDAMNGLPYLRFEAPSVLDEVLCLGYPPIPTFREVQISDLSSINARLKSFKGKIVGKGQSYVEAQEYLLINARVKGGNSGGPIINKRGYAVGILVGTPLDSHDKNRIDELGYGLAVSKDAFVPLLPPADCLGVLPFANLCRGGFSTIVS